MLLKNVTILFITDRLHRVKVESGSSKILRIRIRNTGGFIKNNNFSKNFLTVPNRREVVLAMKKFIMSNQHVNDSL